MVWETAVSLPLETASLRLSLTREDSHVASPMLGHCSFDACGSTCGECCVVALRGFARSTHALFLPPVVLTREVSRVVSAVWYREVHKYSLDAQVQCGCTGTGVP